MNRSRTLAVVALLALAALLLWRCRARRDDGAGHSAKSAGDGDEPRNPRAIPGQLPTATPGDVGPDDGTVADGLALVGKVVRPDRTPVEGATVQLVRRPSSAPAVKMGRRGIVTMPDGSFTFEKQARGDYILEAHDEEGVSPSTPYRLAPGSPPVTLVLFPAAAVDVKVVSAVDDKPIPGATVKLGVGNPLVGAADAFRAALSDEHGVAHFRGVTPVANHPVWAEAPGFAGSYLNIKARDQPTRTWEIRIALKPGVLLTGRVVDDKRQPIAGAKVGWQLGKGDPDGAYGVFVPFADAGRYAAAVTDGDGHFTRTVEAGVGCAVAVEGHHLTGQLCNVKAQANPPTPPIEIVLKAGARISGTVVTSDGKPAANAEVLVTQVGWNHMSMWSDIYRVHTTSDAEGRYTLDGIDRLPIALTAHTDGATSDLVEVDLRGVDEKKDVRLTLQWDGKITGVVQEADGRPIANAVVDYFINPDLAKLAATPTAVVREYSMPTSVGGAVTDENGRFAIRALPPGKFTLRGSRSAGTSVAPEYSSSYMYAIPVGSDIRIVLPGMGSLTGRLVGSDDRPVTSFNVAFAMYSTETKTGALTAPHPLTSADGTFRIDDIPAHKYSVGITASGYVEWRADGGVIVDAGRVADLGTIRLTGGRARPGVVLSERGDPVPSAAITVVGVTPSNLQASLSSDEQGRFELPAMPPGTTVKVQASSEMGIGSDWVTVGDGTDRVELRLGAGGRGSLSGVLIDPGGSADDRMVVLTLVGKGQPGEGLRPQASGVTKYGGRFTFENVAAGDYLLWVRRADASGGWSSQPVTIQDSRMASVVLNVEGSP